MKKLPLIFGVLAIGLLIISLYSCSSKMNYDDMMRDQITNFYSTQDVREYMPISYSAFDTIETVVEGDGKSTKIVGIVAHEYQGVDENGDTIRYEDTFDVTIYKDMVVAIPRGY